MKKSIIKTLLLLILGILVGVLASCGIYFATVGDVAWKEYIEKMIIPNAVLAITTVFALSFVSSPLVKKVILALGLFNKATTDINKTIESGNENQNNISLMREKLEKEFMQMVENVKSELNEYKETLERIDKVASNVERITRIGFGNMTELVTKGYAVEIAKVGTNNERKEK